MAMFINKPQHLHPIRYVRTCAGLSIRRIASALSVQIANEYGQPGGYHEYGNSWWTNSECPFSYSYLAVDPLYPSSYFDSPAHPDKARAENLYNYMQDCFRKIFQRSFHSVLELGTGGGEITAEFLASNLDYIAVEGTTAGCQKLLHRGVPRDRIVFADLRRLPFLGRKFDIVMCTEVAEHIEPFFASRVVENCTLHSDVVWFSAADPDRPAHYHHANEQDIEVWDNLFAFLGYPIHVELDKRLERADRIYLNEKLEEGLRFD